MYPEGEKFKTWGDLALLFKKASESSMSSVSSCTQGLVVPTGAPGGPTASTGVSIKEMLQGKPFWPPAPVQVGQRGASSKEVTSPVRKGADSLDLEEEQEDVVETGLKDDAPALAPPPAAAAQLPATSGDDDQVCAPSRKRSRDVEAPRATVTRGHVKRVK